MSTSCVPRKCKARKSQPVPFSRRFPLCLRRAVADAEETFLKRFELELRKVERHYTRMSWRGVSAKRME